MAQNDRRRTRRGKAAAIITLVSAAIATPGGATGATASPSVDDRVRAIRERLMQQPAASGKASPALRSISQWGKSDRWYNGWANRY